MFLSSLLGGSLTGVFHQEMLNYNLKPCFSYQTKAWDSFKWSGKLSSVFNRKNKLTLRAVARYADPPPYHLIAVASCPRRINRTQMTAYVFQFAATSKFWGIIYLVLSMKGRHCISSYCILKLRNLWNFYRAIVVCYHLMHAVMSDKRPCTILFATETGKSKKCAHKLQRLFDTQFKAQVGALHIENITLLY